MTPVLLSGKTDIILSHARRILSEDELIDVRKIGDNFSDSDIDKLVDRKKYRVVSVKKSTATGYYMNWHYDDAQVIQHKRDVDHIIYSNQEFISDRISIHYRTDRPIYSLIIYHSNHNIDFTGGVFEFSDGIKIYPKKDRFVFFSSKDLHRVTRVLSGTRESTLIKFYAI